MSSIEVDLDDLAAPLLGEQSVGVDLRLDQSYSNPLRLLKDACDEARRIERRAFTGGQSEHDEPVTVAQAMPLWQKIADQGRAILTEKSKDLEVAACLTEAWVRLNGLSGLRMGLSLLKQLVSTYWETVYPLPDEDGVSTRVRPIERLKVVPEALIRLSVTQGSSQGPFAAWQFRQAHEISRLSPEEVQERVDRGAITLEQFNRAIGETDPGFFHDLLTDLHCCREELRSLDAALAEVCPTVDLPSTSELAESLENFEQTVKAVSAGRLTQAGAGDAGSETLGDVSADAGGGGATLATGPLRSREDAFRTLETVAAFFERMDPQSLLAVQVRRIVQLGRLSPAAYFAEMLEDAAARERLFKLVGIPAPEENSG